MLLLGLQHLLSRSQNGSLEAGFRVTKQTCLHGPALHSPALDPWHKHLPLTLDRTTHSNGQSVAIAFPGGFSEQRRRFAVSPHLQGKITSVGSLSESGILWSFKKYILKYNARESCKGLHHDTLLDVMHLAGLYPPPC